MRSIPPKCRRALALGLIVVWATVWVLAVVFFMVNLW
jgi:hypothetical protein